MIYLTAEASAVHFPALGRTERPGTGSLLTWRSVDEEGRRLAASAHAVSEHPASAAQPRIAVSIPILRDAGGAAVMAPLHFGGPPPDRYYPILGLNNIVDPEDFAFATYSIDDGYTFADCMDFCDATANCNSFTVCPTACGTYATVSSLTDGMHECGLREVGLSSLRRVCGGSDEKRREHSLLRDGHASRPAEVEEVAGGGPKEARAVRERGGASEVEELGGGWPASEVVAGGGGACREGSERVPRRRFRDSTAACGWGAEVEGSCAPESASAGSSIRKSAPRTPSPSPSPKME